MNTLPHKHQGFFGWLTLYLIPMFILVAVAAIFLVDRSSSDQWERFVSLLFGQCPVYRTYAHAIMSLRAIPAFGLVFFTFVLLVEMIVSLISRSRVSVAFHVLAAWVLGFLSSFALYYTRWIRIRVEGRHLPLAQEIARAIIFATAYAVVALIAVLLLKKIWRRDPHKDRHPSLSGSPTPPYVRIAYTAVRQVKSAEPPKNSTNWD
ncbi:MAG: hypothetical protein PHO37_15835 [Kiritimatiellae bacterium]|nr:hypothetical protein [Kiritimatiellia bacterium]